MLKSGAALYRRKVFYSWMQMFGEVSITCLLDSSMIAARRKRYNWFFGKFIDSLRLSEHTIAMRRDRVQSQPGEIEREREIERDRISRRSTSCIVRWANNAGADFSC